MSRDFKSVESFKDWSERVMVWCLGSRLQLSEVWKMSVNRSHIRVLYHARILPILTTEDLYPEVLTKDLEQQHRSNSFRSKLSLPKCLIKF